MDSEDEVDRLRRENAALKNKVSQLEMRVQELSTDCKDLQQICSANGVDYVEGLAVRRPRRSFAQTCLAHPVGRTTALSETLSILPIGHLVNESGAWSGKGGEYNSGGKGVEGLGKGSIKGDSRGGMGGKYNTNSKGGTGHFCFS